MFNKVILAGNLTRDVELRYLPSGSALAKIGLAVNRRFKRQDGTQGDEVCYIDVNFFGRTAEVVNQYLKKGSSVLVEGRLVLESWTDSSGQKRSRHSVAAESMQMLGSRGGEYQNDYETNQKPSSPPKKQEPKQDQKEPEIPVIDIDEDEIPF